MLSNDHDIGTTGAAEGMPSAALPAATGAPVEGAALLDAIDIEALILNLDASLRVHASSHFFTWTQGLLRSLLCHEVLICMRRAGGPSSFRFDSFSAQVADAGIFGESLARDILLASKLIEAWRAHRHLPVMFDRLDSGIVGRSALARELERAGATQMVMHGCHDVDGEATSFFIFACRAGTLSPRQLFYVQLLVPFLHAAWMRAQLNAGQRGGEPARQSCGAVTAREQEILKWIHLGKSNGEIGIILGISPLTVKNHVQNLLRRLNVVNRAQAVGKALEARILRP